MYGVAKELAKIPQALVGKSSYHIQNTQDFTEQVKNITLGIGECIISYYVTASFTSVPFNPALNITQAQTRTRPRTSPKDQTNCTAHHTGSGVLSS